MTPKFRKNLKNKLENGPHLQRLGIPLSTIARNLKPSMVFQCQLAHGSPTGRIYGFTSMKELYNKIAECFDIPVNDVLFCTLNTHKVDMNNLLAGHIGLDDFIFAHIRGHAKEIELFKSEEHVGLTITDNNAGLCFIKKIKPDGMVAKLKKCILMPGDHIEKINEKSFGHSKHFEVAKALREIPLNTSFVMRLIEPLRHGFSGICFMKTGRNTQSPYNPGMVAMKERRTLRLKTNGESVVQIQTVAADAAIEKINILLESFMGISDSELAQTIWELGCEFENPSDFMNKVSTSELSEFGFSIEFIFDLWGAVNDAKRVSFR